MSSSKINNHFFCHSSIIAYFCELNRRNMETKELYNIYLQHPLITTDSRECPQGSIFLALKGTSFDGNRFALAALEKGCAYAIVDEKEVYAQYTAAGGGKGDGRMILVDDCLQAFKDLAREHRRRFGIPVIGITGTNGKTTTKELVAGVLAQKYNVLFTQGNFNNDVGVPKTLFRLTEEHQIAVIEMGASHPGDIKTLAETAEPTCGLITNVGKAHLQGFGSFEGVCQTKGELYDFLAARNALVFINADNEYLMRMAEERRVDRLVCYGGDNSSEVWGEVIGCAPFLTFRWRTDSTGWHEVGTHLIGAYNIDNMLAAIAIGLHFGIKPEQIDRALASYVPSNNRSQFDVTGKNKLIVDAYNANPTSMAAALQNFKLMNAGPKMAIIGQMGELGSASHEEHQKVADFLLTAGFEQVWLVGSEFDSVNCPFRRFKDIEEVKAAIAEKRPEGYYILIKGSNSVKLSQLPELL